MKTRDKVKQAAERLGISKLKQEQIEPINQILDGKDALVIYPVGFGKSAIMQVPALVRSERPTIVFEPTVSLMYDQVQHLNSIGIHAEYLACRNKKNHSKILARYKEGKTNILYVAPERLWDCNFRIAISQREPWLIAVDEAHCVLEWGRDFRPLYQKIGNVIDAFEQRPVVLAMTATAPPDYRPDLQQALHMRDGKIFTTSLERPNLILIRDNLESDKIESRCRRLHTLLNRYMGNGRAVIYCATKADADKVYNYLKEDYPEDVAECHAFMDGDERESDEMLFIKGRRRIMIATTAFGMGVDLPDIRLIVHFSMPINPIAYYQQIGRAGRDSEKSHCVLLYHPDDRLRFSKILENEEEKYGKEARKRLEAGIDQMEEIARGNQCMMQAVLNQLGEPNPKPCGHCSVCQRNRVTGI